MSKSRNNYVVSRLLELDDTYSIKPNKRDRRRENKRDRADFRADIHDLLSR